MFYMFKYYTNDKGLLSFETDILLEDKSFRKDNCRRAKEIITSHHARTLFGSWIVSWIIFEVMKSKERQPSHWKQAFLGAPF